MYVLFFFFKFVLPLKVWGEGKLETGHVLGLIVQNGRLKSCAVLSLSNCL